MFRIPKNLINEGLPMTQAAKEAVENVKKMVKE